jgi:tRNA 5-methylaminomethyl-2-thiouridine biosynthesis bifunctional protein
LAQPGVQVVYNTVVTRLQRTQGVWLLQNAREETVAQAELVVVANALGALPLLQGLDGELAPPPDVSDKLQDLQALHGSLSHGPMARVDSAAFPPFAVNGSGSLVSNVPTSLGPQWYAGATYETAAAHLHDDLQQFASNRDRLRALLPASAQAVEAGYDHDLPARWTGTRCVSHDRLPLVGPVHEDGNSGLWLSVAMGSRGLSFAALCAELLVARVAAEPLPIEARLARSLDLHRQRRQRV